MSSLSPYFANSTTPRIDANTRLSDSVGVCFPLRAGQVSLSRLVLITMMTDLTCSNLLDDPLTVLDTLVALSSSASLDELFGATFPLVGCIAFDTGLTALTGSSAISDTV